MLEQKIFITKANGERELFSAEKLKSSLERSNATPELIEKVVDFILKEVEDGMSTHDIYKHAFGLLHKLERPAAARYSLRRAVMTLGPSGFPFEKFVAEIFKSMGYETLTDQTVKGFCVEHEVDVVAWNAEKLIMSEVKFHNELGLKSDLKVVLYVKARFEDLAKNTFNYGGKERRLDEGWLITNTKFTTSAMQYAECQNLKIIGWNYPLNNSLRDMIESAKLNPITTLSSLSERDKQALIERNVILCKTIKENPKTLETIGLSEAGRDAVLEEINLLSV